MGRGAVLVALGAFGAFGAPGNVWSGAPTAAAQAQESTWRGLTIRPESRCAPYDRADYAYPRSRERDVQDEIGSTAGGWYGLYEARIFASGRETDVEHVVAAAEAHDSGLCGRSAEEKAAFANDLNNLTLASPDLNRREKSDQDAGDWLPPNARCWFARTVVFVKQTHRLTVDEAERDELERVLGACESGRVPARTRPGSGSGGAGVDPPPVRGYRNCDAMRAAGWNRGVRRNGGSYRAAWNDAEVRTYGMNTARDGDKDGHACE